MAAARGRGDRRRNPRTLRGGPEISAAVRSDAARREACRGILGLERVRMGKKSNESGASTAERSRAQPTRGLRVAPNEAHARGLDRNPRGNARPARPERAPRERRGDDRRARGGPGDSFARAVAAAAAGPRVVRAPGRGTRRRGRLPVGGEAAVSGASGDVLGAEHRRDLRGEEGDRGGGEAGGGRRPP